LEKGLCVRKSNKEAALTREAIVATAADYIRSAGLMETSVVDVMTAAGLTHGGFYKHFRNKDHLVTEAIATAGDKVVAAVGEIIAEGGLNAVADTYLSTNHRDAATPLCPFASLGSELGRSGEATKSAATAVLERLVAELTQTARGAEARGDAIAALSTMVGALTLSRIVSDPGFSAEILDGAKRYLRR
jgi:TetR/AcrR family transcriptional repressor of nem operon